MITGDIINSVWENALRDVISKNQVPNEQVKTLLRKYGYEKLNEIEITNYKKIYKELGGQAWKNR